tara:strand:+ start:520 stop:1539 length:1020 start_codon:yes stop_codon:yes gene_type:complete
LSYLINPYWYAAAGSAPFYQELGRETLGSDQGEVDVTGLTDKPYLMFLASYDCSTSVDAFINFNNDETANYANRYSRDGGADATDVNQSIGLRLEQGSTNPQFSVMFAYNKAAQEKLIIGNTTSQNTASASNAPNRQEFVGKWVNTSDAIDQVSLDRASGNFLSGSELVILGCDPADTTGTNFWEELGTTTASGGEDSLSVTVDKKYLWFQMYKIQSGGTTEANLRFNGVTASDYAWRISTNGSADAAFGSQARLVVDRIASTTPSFSSGFIINNADQEKLVTSVCVAEDVTGVGTAPARRELSGKWADSTTAITSVDMTNEDVGSYGAGSFITVWGHD